MSFAILFSACQPVSTPTALLSSSPTTTIKSTLPPMLTHEEPTSTAVSRTLTPTLIPTQMAGQLAIITYELQAPPELEPILFTSVQGRQFSNGDFSLGDTRFPDLSFFDDMHYCMKNDLDGAHLVACQEFNQDGTKGSVKLTRNGSEIYSIDTGPGSPVNNLQGLWVYDQHWVLETAYVTTHTSDNVTTIDVTGHITIDGVLLNDKKKYDEAFGFQTIAGKPFFLFKRGGKIGFSYDGVETPLDYDAVPHYGCCSAGALNPQAWENHINFFGQRGETWFFVTIGILNQ
jgi:hypothetical protein